MKSHRTYELQVITVLYINNSRIGLLYMNNVLLPEAIIAITEKVNNFSKHTFNLNPYGWKHCGPLQELNYSHKCREYLIRNFSMTYIYIYSYVCVSLAMIVWLQSDSLSKDDCSLAICVRERHKWFYILFSLIVY